MALNIYFSAFLLDLVRKGPEKERFSQMVNGFSQIPFRTEKEDYHWRLESLYGGQFTLSTPFIKPNFCILLPHRRSTTVSLETTPSTTGGCPQFRKIVSGKLPIQFLTSNRNFRIFWLIKWKASKVLFKQFRGHDLIVMHSLHSFPVDIKSQRI